MSEEKSYKTRSGVRIATSVKVPNDDWNSFDAVADGMGLSASGLLSMLVKGVAAGQIKFGLTVTQGDDQ